VYTGKRATPMLLSAYSAQVGTQKKSVSVELLHTVLERFKCPLFSKQFGMIFANKAVNQIAMSRSCGR